MEALTRIRELFVRQPIFRDGDKPPRVYFDLTDFVNPVTATAITDIGNYMTDVMPMAQVDAVVSLADRSCGAIAHEVARIADVPYTLANWYPEGCPGEIEVQAHGGFSGSGRLWLNGLKRNRRVVLVLDVLKTGAVASTLLQACYKAGCQVVAVAFAVELIEFEGRKNCADVFEGIPVHAAVRLHVRGERTSDVRDAEAILGPTAAQTLARRLKDNASGGQAGRDISKVEEALDANLEGADSIAAIRAALTANDPTTPYRMLPADEVAERHAKIQVGFVGVPITPNPLLGGYPYSLFQLTDFTPLLTPDIVEAMADLMVHYGAFQRCDLIVAESDRGGAPLAAAVARRTKLPFVLANWFPIGEGMGATTATNVGFSGVGNIVLNGVRSGDRCIFVDDMLSSGGTAEGVLSGIVKLGGVPLQAIFASEKLYPPKVAGSLPWRKGKERVEAGFQQVEIITLTQFIAEHSKTTAPHGRIG